MPVPMIPVKRIPAVSPKERMRAGLKSMVGAEPESLHGDSAYASEFFDIHRDGVTQGFFEKVLSCPWKAHLAYEQGLEPEGFNYPMEFGNIAHAVLDGVYSTYRDNPISPVGHRETLALLSADKYLAEDETWRRGFWKERSFAGEAEEGLNLAYALMPDLIRAHFVQNDDLRGGIRWEALEEPFSIPYEFKSSNGRPLKSPVPPIPIRGKIDGRFRRNGQLRFIDHKTKGTIEVEFLKKQLALDPQVLIYNWALKRLTGESPKGMVYNCIRRTQLKQGKGSLADFVERVSDDMMKRPEFYFIRFDIDFLPEDELRFEENFAGMMEYAVLWSRGMFRFRNGFACMGRYGACGFLDLCGCSDPLTRKRFQRREHVYPELVPLTVLKQY